MTAFDKRVLSSGWQTSAVKGQIIYIFSVPGICHAAVVARQQPQAIVYMSVCLLPVKLVKMGWAYLAWGL